MNRGAKSWVQVRLYTLLLVCSGCQQNIMLQAEEIDDANKKSASAPQNEKYSMPAEISVEQQIEGAKLDLASRLGIELNAIAVKEARAVQWGSGALGCPKSGLSYPQAIIPGVLVKLEAGGTLYRYHGRVNSQLFFCPDDRAQEPAYGPGMEIM